jgi:hypothetical protein
MGVTDVVFSGYGSHRLDLKTPIEKTVQAMAELKA